MTRLQCPWRLAMYQPNYSKSILDGVRAAGVSLDRLTELLGPESDDVELILSGLTGLSDAAVERIERATGRTAGQLAAQSLGSDDDGGLPALFDRFAELND